jgi:outer membrane protein assembly factor BamB
MKTLSACHLGVGLGVLFCFCASGGNWPAWRGPEGTGNCSEQSLPLKWSTNENVRWRIPLPAAGNSSPIVWGDHVFVTQAVPEERRRTLMCFDRATGKLRWQSGVTYTEPEPTQEDNPYCAGTPATDGQHVFACFGSAGVYAYDFEGKEVWRRDLGKLNHMFGNAISPVLYGELLLLNFGPDAKARLVALNKKTGETVWEAQPPPLDPEEREQAPGGRGFGMGAFLGPLMLMQADKNEDKKVSKEEFAALADTWFDKLDPNKTGKVNQQQFKDHFSDLFPPPPGFDGRAAERRTEGPKPSGGQPAGPGAGLFTAADSDKNGTMTRAELKETFAKWFTAWDKDNAGSLDEAKLRNGLNSVLPMPQMAGPGGPGEHGPGGPGPAGGGPRGGGGGGPGGGGGMDPTGSWSTPVIVHADGHDELVVNFAYRLVGYEPKTGKQLWLSKGLTGATYTTPAAGGGTVIALANGIGNGLAIALKPGGSGDVTESQRLWRLPRIKNSIGSGVIHEGHFYAISAEGIAECFELKTGNKIWEERLQGPTSRNSSWSSMLLAGDKIYVPNQSGDVFVLRAEPKFEVLACNSINEPTNASLAASDGELFLRTDKGLWCFGSGEGQSASGKQ